MTPEGGARVQWAWTVAGDDLQVLLNVFEYVTHFCVSLSHSLHFISFDQAKPIKRDPICISCILN
jgi:hypothetical protein